MCVCVCACVSACVYVKKKCEVPSPASRRVGRELVVSERGRGTVSPAWIRLDISCLHMINLPLYLCFYLPLITMSYTYMQ